MFAMCSKVIIFVVYITSAYCANILGVFMFPSISHQVVYQPIWRELSLRGHNVIVVTPDPLNDPSLTNLTEISVRYAYEILKKNKLQSIVSKDRNIFRTMSAALRLMDAIVEAELSNSQFQELIRNEKREFDLILIECFHPVMYALSGRFKAPVIGVSSLGVPAVLYGVVGNPTHPVLYPDMLLNYHSKELSLWQKIESVVYHIWSIYYHQYITLPKAQEMAVKYFGKDVPYVGDLEKNISMLFLNVNPLMYPPRPNVPAIVELGQMHIKPVKPLPKDLQRILDDATEGVIYFSLGSNVRSVDIGENLIKTLIRAFSELPYKVIWKWEADHLPGKPSNVITRKWLPQQDILAHPNIRAFITQGGLQSTEEAISRAVPLVGMPFIGDQSMNVQKIVDLGIGLQFDPNTVTKEELKMGVIEVSQNSMYKTKINEIRDILFDKPMTGLEKAVWWSEYVIRHKGARHLRSRTADVSWLNYLMWDVWLSFVTIVIAIAYISYKLLQLFVTQRREKLKGL